MPPTHQYLCGCLGAGLLSFGLNECRSLIPGPLGHSSLWSIPYPVPEHPKVQMGSCHPHALNALSILITECDETLHREGHLGPAHLAPRWSLVFLLQSHSLNFCFLYRPSSSSFPFAGILCYPFLSLPGLCELGPFPSYRPQLKHLLHLLNLKPHLAH